MEVLELDGVKYVKANSIARELGYTSDYVGQLCRNGKVEAQLVGRSWYVNETSIRQHKAENSRSNKKKSVSTLKRTVQAQGEQDDTTAVPIHREAVNPASGEPSHHFYTRSKLAKAKYEVDERELIPTLTERENAVPPTSIPVELAGARQVPIKKAKKSYTLTASKHPRIRFTGKVSVVEPAEDSEAPDTKAQKSGEEQSGEAKQPPAIFEKSIAEKRPTATTKQTLTVRDHDAGHTVQSVPLQGPQVVAMTRSSAHRQGDGRPQLTKSRKRLSASRANQPVAPAHQATLPYILTSLLVALLLGASLVLIEHSISITSGSGEFQSRYEFNLSTAIDSLYR